MIHPSFSRSSNRGRNIGRAQLCKLRSTGQISTSTPARMRLRHALVSFLVLCFHRLEKFAYGEKDGALTLEHPNMSYLEIYLYPDTYIGSSAVLPIVMLPRICASMENTYTLYRLSLFCDCTDTSPKSSPKYASQTQKQSCVSYDLVQKVFNMTNTTRTWNQVAR